MRAKLPPKDARGATVYVRLRGNTDSEIRAFAAQRRLTLNDAIDLAVAQFLRDERLFVAVGEVDTKLTALRARLEEMVTE